MHGISKAFLSVHLPACLSARLSDAWIVTKRTKLVPTFLYRIKSFILVFWQEESLVGATPSAWNFGLNWPCWSENADFQSIFPCSASAITPSEKSSIITNRRSTTRFSMSLGWTAYVAPKPHKKGVGGLQNAKWPFSVESALHWKKVSVWILSATKL